MEKITKVSKIFKKYITKFLLKLIIKKYPIIFQKTIFDGILLNIYHEKYKFNLLFRNWV